MRTRRAIATMVAVLGGIWLVALAAEARPAAPGPGLATTVDGFRAKGLTDGVVLVAVRGRLVANYAFGLANRETGVATTLDARFRIGSITKQFTAAAILQLAQAHKLSLDDPVTRYVDAPRWSRITLRELLTHTSGVPNYTDLPGWSAWDDRSAADVVGLLAGLPLVFEPGSRFAYDNSGYVILGYVVEKVSGQPLDQYVATQLMAPAGMSDSGFVSPDPVPQRAYGYVREGGGWRAARWSSNVHASGAGGIYSTAGDLLKWEQALVGRRLLQPDAVAQMFHDYGNRYGFGVSQRVEGGRTVWWHNGHVEGYSAMLSWAPDKDVTVIVLSNDDAAPVEPLAGAVMDLYERGDGSR